MSSCKIDHTLEDVQKKLDDQKPFLPEELYNGSVNLLNQKPDQQTLNELFHLLKKYDLAPVEEKEQRNEKLQSLIN
ncbi:group-specific protein [Halalkalibacter nanhaiisediminis]|uniref:Group-specific protein n=1 Tax=Halalkalibacter nanhaiisediminis TaxID=688079 RepID=A0A562QCQ2_9BACI|nr:group-specific protein [Halalkalibacter nanhaiisediminis]TWI53940.1 hypothetical protein IQ10_03248 [Halalkalibacter nanhaiisediminis]